MAQICAGLAPKQVRLPGGIIPEPTRNDPCHTPAFTHPDAHAHAGTRAYTHTHTHTHIHMCSRSHMEDARTTREQMQARVGHADRTRGGGRLLRHVDAGSWVTSFYYMPYMRGSDMLPYYYMPSMLPYYYLPYMRGSDIRHGSRLAKGADKPGRGETGERKAGTIRRSAAPCMRMPPLHTSSYECSAAVPTRCVLL